MANELAKLYLGKCTNQPAFVNGKPTVSFWKLRKFFIQQEDSICDNIYTYLLQLSPTRLTLTDVIVNATQFNMEVKREMDKESTKSILATVKDPYSITSFLEL